MIKLTSPPLISSNVFNDCVSVVRNPNLRLRLNSCAPLILQAEQEFNDKITTGNIYTILRETLVNGNVAANELVRLYTGRMVGNHAGRVHYDIILTLAKDGLCPYCAHRNVTTLDHYLPKAEYPRLSTVPINLVPSCKDCNTDKIIDYPTIAEEETLHPYYDDIDGVDWLKMEVIQSNPLTVNFSVQRPANWPVLLYNRVESHFRSYDLGNLYRIQAARELGSLKRLVADFYASGGENEVRRNLSAMGVSKAEYIRNQWSSVLYRDLAADDWFCSGGFQFIG